jgi:exosortase/archaeosortase family protein
MLGFISLPGPPLLGTTGTELLLFALLAAAGSWRLRCEGRDAGRFFGFAFAGVSLFYFLCPDNSTLQRHTGQGLMYVTAALQAGLMRLGGTNVHVEGVSVVGNVGFTLARGCLGLSYLAMGVIFLLAYPMAWRRRLAAAATLTVAMVWLNAFRLITLYHLWDLGEREAYHAFHRAGGVCFALLAFGLFCGALSARPRTKPSGAEAASLEGARETA